jgi:hypothetical protein
MRRSFPYRMLREQEALHSGDRRENHQRPPGFAKTEFTSQYFLKTPGVRNVAKGVCFCLVRTYALFAIHYSPPTKMRAGVQDDKISTHTEVNTHAH